MDEHAAELIRGRFDPRVARVFSWIAHRMLRRAFAAVRIERASSPELERAAASRGPVLLLVNHPSWWDPIVVTLLRNAFFRDREIMAPMDSVELRRFRVFARLGVFGIDPDDPRSARRLVAEVERRWRASPRGLLVVTPQGRMTDAREDTVLRPGAALIAARRADRTRLEGLEGLQIMALSIEYVFWSARKPEVLLAASRVDTPAESSARAWLDEMTRAMEECRRRLARLSIARKESAFDTLLGGRAPSDPYALWLRLTGRGAEIDATRRPRGPEGRGP